MAVGESRMRCAATIYGALCVCSAAGCARARPQRGSEPAPVAAEGPRYGAVMSEVGRRFELAGRAAQAGRFALADFEVGELQELFEEDLPRAELPQEGPSASLPAMAAAFLQTQAPALKRAAAAKNLAAFAQAFATAATACNGCHQASGHGFIEIPGQPGRSVPELGPMQPAQGPQPAQ
jgi:hypothetical protein